MCIQIKVTWQTVCPHSTMRLLVQMWKTFKTAANLHSKRWDCALLRETAKNHRVTSQTLPASVSMSKVNVYGAICRKNLNKYGFFGRINEIKPLLRLCLLKVSYIIPWYTKHETFEKGVLSYLHDCILEVLFTNIRLIVSFTKQQCQHYKVAQVIFFLFKAWESCLKKTN